MRPPMHPLTRPPCASQVADVVQFLSELKPHQRPVWAVEMSDVVEKKMTKNLKVPPSPSP